MSLDRELDKEDLRYIIPYISTVEYYSVIRKDEIMTFTTTGMDLESIMLSEISQTKKVKNFMISLIVGYKTESNK